MISNDVKRVTDLPEGVAEGFLYPPGVIMVFGGVDVPEDAYLYFYLANNAVDVTDCIAHIPPGAGETIWLYDRETPAYMDADPDKWLYLCLAPRPPLPKRKQRVKKALPPTPTGTP